MTHVAELAHEAALAGRLCLILRLAENQHTARDLFATRTRGPEHMAMWQPMVLLASFPSEIFRTALPACKDLEAALPVLPIFLCEDARRWYSLPVDAGGVW